RSIKVLFPILSLFIIYRTVRYYRTGKPVISNRSNKLAISFERIVKGNRAFFSNLHIYTRIGLLMMIAAQLITFAWLLNAIPYNYDEAWSYTYFSGHSLMSALTFYPVPNNHVLQNVLASLFLWLPV